jgi:rubrerythrin
MTIRPEDYTKAQLIDLVGDLESRLNETYSVDPAPGADQSALVTELQASVASLQAQLDAANAEKAQREQESPVAQLQETIANLEAQLSTAQADLAKREDEAAVAALRDTIASLEAQVTTLTAERQALQQAQSAAASTQPAGDLAKAMQATDLDQPIYVTLHGTTYDLTEAAGVQACRDTVSRTLGDTGIMLVKLLQHRAAQEKFRELSSVLPGGGHNTARMTQLGQAIADASQRLTETFVDGKAVSQLISRLYQDRGLLDQCLQSLQTLDMDTRRHAKGDSI